MKSNRINPKALKVGTEIELEHTKDRRKARKIAVDHLKEYPDYYNKDIGLPAMEKKLSKLEKNKSIKKIKVKK